jgi:hypothetical protein
MWDEPNAEVEKNTNDESIAPTRYDLFLDGKKVYASNVTPLNKALSEITTYIKKLTPDQKNLFSLSWEFDESKYNDYYEIDVYDDDDNLIGSTEKWKEFTGDVVVGVFSEAECKEYGYAFPEDRFVVNVAYAGEAIRKAFDADVTANY